MKIYNAHPVTGEFMGESLADADPLEEGNWLIPAHAYLDAPPLPGENEAVIRKGDVWAVVDDFRGTSYYTDGPQRYVIEDLGVCVPVGATAEPPPPTSAELASAAFGKRDSFLFTAGLRIAPLQDAVDLGDATAADADKLRLWKQYRVAVNRITDQPSFPQNIDWPPQPS
ncbi:tail fiber assembly protein [Pseudomonas sp. BF-R-01]|uniref:tail fiber assembly protein n=1 Tax=Pseudomonas sp. BF-R-01 TaxID=2832365 RepID=UPI001CBD4016|nr:tail fiber assembly protein [Pseudomonas sp. BF-R-01]